MTVLTDTTKKTYAGDGSSVSFSTVFTFDANSEVKVSLSNDTTGVSVDWTEGTQYILTGSGTGNAGTITVDTSPTDYTPATGETLVVELDPSFTQPTPLPRGGTVSPKAVLEPMHDNRVRQILTLRKETNKAIKVPTVDASPDLDLPIAALRANKAMAFDSNGDVAISTLDIDDIESGSIDAAASAAAALVSETNAAASEAAAEAALDTFDDRYLGSKTVEPTLDNDGNALTDGALYFNTTSNVLFVYDIGTTTWIDVGEVSANSTTVFTNKTLDDPTNTVHADAVHLKSRNVSGGGFVKGQAVYESAYNSGQDAIEILLADADDVSKMPSLGIVDEGILNNANGEIIKVGVITGDATDTLDTTGGGESWAVGDDLYVSTTAGALTNVRPTGATEQVQAIAVVLRVHATLGTIFVDGAGRANDIPNLITARGQIQWKKGADIASGAALPLLTDGNYFDITGTTNITSIDTTGQIGTVVKFHMDGNLDFVDDADNIINNTGGVDITTAAGDELEFTEYASGKFIRTGGAKADGTAFAGSGGIGTLIGTQEASASASLTQTGLDATYDTYAVVISDMVPATDSNILKLRLGDSGGIDSGASDYEFAIASIFSASYNNDTTADHISISHPGEPIGSASGEGIAATFFIGKPSDGSTFGFVYGQCQYGNTTPDVRGNQLGGHRSAVITLDRLQIFFNSGNIASGRMSVYGISHA